MTIRETERAPLPNTFGIDARAGVLIECDDAADLPGLFSDTLHGASPLVLGGGSNLLIVEGPRVALRLTARDMRILDAGEDRILVRADAGAEWHAFVLWTLEQGCAGLENLALIPGTVGAAPIQNIGAYGVEVGERIVAVEAFERATGAFRRFAATECAFAYRDSLFKREPDRWLIVAVEFALPPAAASSADALKLDYAGIRDEIATAGVAKPGPRDVADAVIRLRRRKLPDPDVVGNAGSFFKNPIVPASQAEALLVRHPSLPVFRADDAGARKLSAAWLIEQCGWKGARADFGSGDAGVSEKHALVLVNHGGANGAELLALARQIADSVRTRFGVSIEPEPRIVGAAW
ncbi:MAG: UDP-N-acetylmuramate dehydrogenase [Pseudomonadota bacterium]